MSLIGSIETFNLSTVLQRIEAHAKTGQLLIKQGEHWVELYFRHGQLMCIGPIRLNTTLGDRLLQAGVISQQALQEALCAIGESQLSETRMALTLIDLGYVNHESLYNWAAQEAAKVIGALLQWKTGEVYFENDLQPPVDRLLIALSVGSLLTSQDLTGAAASSIEAFAPAVAQEQPESTITTTVLPDSPTLFEASQFFTEATSPGSLSAASLLSPESPIPTSNIKSDTLTPPPLSQPTKITTPLSPRRIDTSFMQPQMVIIPVDLSTLRGHNSALQLTPEQWRLLTRADGQTSLQTICHALGMPKEMVCQLAGELIALGLVTVVMPPSGVVNELSPVSRNMMNSGLGNGYVAPGQAASTVQPWIAIMPTVEGGRPFSSTGPIETQSQWGNGGNGATFVLGGGWVLASQSVQSSGPIHLPNGAFAQIGGTR